MVTNMSSYERSKLYFQTSAQEISAISEYFPISNSDNSKTKMKNQGNRNNLLYVVFYKLSDDTRYFVNERT